MERRNEYHFADTGNMVAGAERAARRAGGMSDIHDWRAHYRARLATPKRRKLSEADYRAIVRRRRAGEPLAAIAAAFGVSVSHVCKIARGYRRVDMDAA